MSACGGRDLRDQGVKSTQFKVEPSILFDVVRVDTMNDGREVKLFVGRFPSTLAAIDVSKAMTAYLKDNPEDGDVKVLDHCETEVM
jgi:hypothetical protein